MSMEANSEPQHSPVTRVRRHRSNAHSIDEVVTDLLESITSFSHWKQYWICIIDGNPSRI